MNPKTKRSQKKEHRPKPKQVPCFHSVLMKAGLIDRTVSVGDAYQLFLRIGADNIVQSKKGKGFPRRVTQPYLQTALKLGAMTADELKSLKLRTAEFR